MSDMEKNESFERFSEGLLKAASRARELAKAQQYPTWNIIANNLDQLRKNGTLMYESRAISRQSALDILDRRETLMGKEVN